MAQYFNYIFCIFLNITWYDTDLVTGIPLLISVAYFTLAGEVFLGNKHVLGTVVHSSSPVADKIEICL